MGKVYGPPEEVGPAPQIEQPFDFEIYQKKQEEYVAAIIAWAKANGTGEHAGAEFSYPVADGHARYVVLSLKPVQLIHLPVGDAWRYPHHERLTAVDIKRRINQQQGLKAIFERQPTTATS